MKNLILLIGSTLLSFSVNSQMLAEIPLEHQVDNADVIVEGKVTAKKSYWDEGKKNIYTVHTIDVSRVLKGTKTDQINIVTLGGAIGFKIQTAQPNLHLNIGDTGVFVANKDTISLEGHDKSPLSKVAGLSQGYYRYKKDDSKVVSPFATFSNHKALVDKITSLTAEPIKTVKQVDYFPLKKKQSQQKLVTNAVAATATVAISSISPTQITAGNASVLTINGSGFGTTKGEVYFYNADDAGATEVQALETQITSWSDTQIKVEVPGRAGSGSVRIKNATGGESTRGGLVITHSYIANVFNNSQLRNGETHEYQLHHVANYYNSASTIFDNGAYSFRYHTDFKNNTAAVNAFENGFDDIVCKAGIDFKISTTTTTTQTPAEDNINSISFDALSSGLLGQATTRLQVYPYNHNGLTYTDAYIAVVEIDFVFNNSVSWDFDLDGNTTTSEFDFNGVVRHETGHAAGLGHVIDIQKIMHYSVGTGSQQSVSSSTLYEPIKWKITRDKNSSPPSGVVTKTDFSSCYTLSTGELIDTSIVLYPNPAKNQITITAKTAIDAVKIHNLNGALVGKHTNQNNNAISIDVNSYAQGVYFAEVMGAQGSQRIKFIKK